MRLMLSQNGYIVLPGLYESKKCVKDDTIYIKNFLLLKIVLLDDEPGVSKKVNFMLFL